MQKQIIDDLIHSVSIITQNQGSFSEEDQYILKDALKKLEVLKMKKGRTNQQVLKEIAIVIGLLTKFFN